MRFLIATVVLGLPFPALAQQPPPAREGKLEVALVATSGNSETQSIGIAGESTLRPAAWALSVKAGFVRNKADGVVSAKSIRAHGRAARTVKPGVEAFGQYGYLRDLFSGVAHRSSFDAGLSYRLVASARHELSADAGIGYLREWRTVDARLSTGLTTGSTRYRFRVSEGSELTDELIFAMDLDADGTWRLNHNAAVTAQINSVMALKLSNVLRFVNEPVEGFERTDTITSASLVMSF